MMKILVIGSSGLVGSRFVELSKFKDSLLCPSREELDITRVDISLPPADVVINFSAFTDVAEGENQRNNKNGTCWQINVEGVRNLMKVCKDRHFIQLSTDLAFAGQSGPYDESQIPETDSSKVTWYGFTKGEAEKLCQGQTILRIIYPVRAKFDKKLDYLRKPLSLFDQGKLYTMFTDQQVSFSFIDEICLAIDRIIEKHALGIYHASSSDLTNPFELYSYLFEKARGIKNAVKPGLLSDFLKTAASPVRYPMYGGLRVDITQKILGIKYSSWRGIIDRLVEQGI